MTKKVEIGKSVLKKNDEYAAENRELFTRKKLLVVNLISSPGSGKTTLLERMAEILGDKMAVIEGDLRTERDAERIRKHGVRAYQIETGGSCHLNAKSVQDALVEFDLGEKCLILIIENVGNLVCPSAYDLGEHMKAAILSVPEGDDKVLKYPTIFSKIDLMLINKIDLLPYLDFDVDRAVNECKSLNDSFEYFRVSAKDGEGVEEFCRNLLERQSTSKA